MLAAMKLITSDPSLSGAGRRRAAEFTWPPLHEPVHCTTRGSSAAGPASLGICQTCPVLLSSTSLYLPAGIAGWVKAGKKTASI